MSRHLLGIVVSAAGIAGGLSGSGRLAVAQLATTVQLPTFGVAVDAAGVLRVKAFADPTGSLQAERLRAAKMQRPADLAAPIA